MRIRQLVLAGLTAVLVGTGVIAAAASSEAAKLGPPKACVIVRRSHHLSPRAHRREARACTRAKQRRKQALAAARRRRALAAARRKKAQAAARRKRVAAARARKKAAAKAAAKAREPKPKAASPAPTAPAGSPTQPSAPSQPASASVIWNGDLSTGNTSQYSAVQQCTGTSPPRGVTVVSSPVHAGYAHSSMFTVSDASIAANCPTLGSAGHPNANLQSPGLFSPGDVAYIGFSTDFPSSFPNNVCTPWIALCWLQIMEIYGQPYGGVPPVAMYVIGDKLVLDGNGTAIWTAAHNFTKNVWQDVVLHVSFSTNPKVGFVELWLGGVQQTLTNGQTRYYEATLKSGVNWDGTDANRLYLDQYRGATPAMGTVTLYHGAAKVASTYAGAAP